MSGIGVFDLHGTCLSTNLTLLASDVNPHTSHCWLQTFTTHLTSLASDVNPHTSRLTPVFVGLFVLSVKDESDVLDAYIACGGNEDKSGCVHRDLLVKIIKGDFGLPIDIEALINKVCQPACAVARFVSFQTVGN